MLIVLTTVSGEQQPEELARAIVERRLAACVQILPHMVSVYVWEGEVQRAGEHLLLIKTFAEKYDELEAFIEANHSYETRRSSRSMRTRIQRLCEVAGRVAKLFVLLFPVRARTSLQ